jgi:hypothetical protein
LRRGANLLLIWVWDHWARLKPNILFFPFILRNLMPFMCKEGVRGGGVLVLCFPYFTDNSIVFQKEVRMLNDIRLCVQTPSHFCVQQPLETCYDSVVVQL